MGTVTTLTPVPAVTPRDAAGAYLACLASAEHAGTRRVYGGILGRFAARFDGVPDVASIGAGELAEWFTAQWARRAPSTSNVALDAIRSAAAYWAAQGWIAADPSQQLQRRRPAEDRTRALSRAQVEELLTRDSVPLREKTLWRMLYETAARSAEVLRLDAGGLDMPNRCARVRRKGGATDLIVWQSGTARLLSRYLKGRTCGPLFVTQRKARVELPLCDIDPATGRARLSYVQAEQLFKAASGGKSLHTLRHSSLSHAAEDGVNTAMLMARSGHTRVRSLVRYARVSAEALMRHQAEHDPARRR